MEVNVAYSSSDAYAKCTGISLLSLLHNNQEIETLNIYLFTTDMSDHGRAALYEIAGKYSRQLTFIDIHQQIELLAKQLKLESMRGGYNTYVRLFCSVWLEFLDRVLFIDSDTLVVGSIVELFCVNMEDKLIAAVPDAGVYGRTAYVEDIEIVNKCSKYINAGIVLINLKQWKDENTNKFIAEKIQEYQKEWLNQEQSILNYVLYNRCTYVHLKYNYYTTFHFESYENIDVHIDLARVFTRDECAEAQKAPIIIHFVGLPYIRPWYEKNISPFRNVYMEYYNKSPWKDIPLEVFPKNPQIGYRIYDYILFITQKHKWDRLHKFIRFLFGEKLKRYLKILAGKRE